MVWVPRVWVSHINEYRILTPKVINIYHNYIASKHCNFASFSFASGLRPKRGTPRWENYESKVIAQYMYMTRTYICYRVLCTILLVECICVVCILGFGVQGSKIRVQA